MPKSESLSKVGHALHWLHPVFKEISFSKKVQDLCNVLRMEAPVLLQSMYIYKNPQIGGEGNNYLIILFTLSENGFNILSFTCSNKYRAIED